MPSQSPENPKLNEFRSEVAKLRSLGLLGSTLSPVAVKEARRKLKDMSEAEQAEATREMDEKIQADKDYWDRVEDDEIWTGF